MIKAICTGLVIFYQGFGGLVIGKNGPPKIGSLLLSTQVHGDTITILGIALLDTVLHPTGWVGQTDRTDYVMV